MIQVIGPELIHNPQHLPALSVHRETSYHAVRLLATGMHRPPDGGERAQAAAALSRRRGLHWPRSRRVPETPIKWREGLTIRQQAQKARDPWHTPSGSRKAISTSTGMASSPVGSAESQVG